jgi:hypothetical protein
MPLVRKAAVTLAFRGPWYPGPVAIPPR